MLNREMMNVDPRNCVSDHGSRDTGVTRGPATSVIGNPIEQVRRKISEIASKSELEKWDEYRQILYTDRQALQLVDRRDG